MVDKFYYEILEQHLKQADQIKPYREELEKNTKTFNELLFDVAFDRPFKIFNEAKEKFREINFDPNQRNDAFVVKNAEAGTVLRQINLDEPKLWKKHENGNWEEVIPETKVKEEVGAELKREINYFSRAAMFSYLITSLAEKRKIKEDQDIIKETQETPQLKSTLFTDFQKSLEISDSEEPLKIATLKEATPNSVAKSGIVNKILVSMNTGSQEFKNSLADAQDTQKFVDDVYGKIRDRVKQDFHEPQTSLKMFFDSDKGGRIIHGIVFNQLSQLGYGPEKIKTFAKLIDSVLNDSEKTFSKIFGSTIASNFTGDLSASDVVDVLQQTGKLNEIMNGAFKTLSGKVSSLAEMLNTAANKVFQGQIIGANPALKQTVEERSLMDVVNDHVFYGDVSKKKLVNTKFWNEASFDAVDNPTTPAAVPQGMSVGSSTKTAAPEAPQTGPQSEPKIAPKDQPQQPMPQQTKPDVNALSIAKNNALRQTVAMITMATVMSFLSSFAQHFKSLVAKPTNEEEIFTEGFLDVIAKGVGGYAKALGGFLKNFTSAIPTDLNELSNQETFNKVASILLKQAKNDEFKNVLNQFNFSRQATDFSSEIFNASVLNKNASKINEAIAKAKADTERALNQFNETSLQKIMQNAYLSNAPKGVKAAYKVAGAIDKFKTKMQGV